MKFIIGKKLGMTQVFKDDGTVVPVTRVQAGPCVVTQVKTDGNNGVSAVQVGFGEQKVFRLNKSIQGHLKDITKNADVTVRHMHDFKNTNQLERGDVITVGVFNSGDKVQVTGTSKGKGFQGVVKRHGFAGGPASHGHKDNLRMPGSIGAGGVQRVFKNMRMGGHMGNEQVTVKNLEVVEVNAEQNELLIKGAVPGARNGIIYVIAAEGTIEINREQVKPEVVEQAEEVIVNTEVVAPVETVVADADSTPQEEKQEEKQEVQN